MGGKSKVESRKSKVEGRKSKVENWAVSEGAEEMWHTRLRVWLGVIDPNRARQEAAPPPRNRMPAPLAASPNS